MDHNRSFRNLNWNIAIYFIVNDKLVYCTVQRTFCIAPIEVASFAAALGETWPKILRWGSLWREGADELNMVFLLYSKVKSELPLLL